MNAYPNSTPVSFCVYDRENIPRAILKWLRTRTSADETVIYGKNVTSLFEPELEKQGIDIDRDSQDTFQLQVLGGTSNVTLCQTIASIYGRSPRFAIFINPGSEEIPIIKMFADHVYTTVTLFVDGRYLYDAVLSKNPGNF